MPSKRVLIVGGVAGGASCAARLRRLDERAEICIFERGGDVSFANCGLPYYVGGAIADRRQLLVSTPERFRNLFEIEVRTRHVVQRIDRDSRTITVRNLATGESSSERYDALVLSTGATPIRPPLPGIDLPGVFTLRDLNDVDQIHTWLEHREPSQAVIVGGGYIGLEMVENLRRRGLSVTLIEMTDQVMPPMDREMVAPAHEELERHGIDLRVGSAVAAFEPGPGDTITAVTQRGERFSAGIVILAAGVKPDVQLAHAAGLEIGPTGGIRVDEQMRTNDPAIFAVGDAVEARDFVTGLPALLPLAGPANRQGRIAADVICGRNAHYRGTQGTAVVGVFDLTLAMTGATEKSLRRAGIPFEKSYTHTFHHASYYPGAERIHLKLLFAPESGRLLGAQAVGRQGVEWRIDVIAMAIQNRATVFDLEEAELCYAPQYGAAKDAVNIGGFVAANALRGDVRLGHWSQWKEREAAGDPPVTLDVRPPKDVAANAIPGTIRIPLSELRARLDELPRDREIWVHCTVGQTSYNAVRLLAQHGFNVRNLSGGIASYGMES
ncbi:MAG: FAD-dependent oxidoreductase [Planctomycetaceae bacterium]|nr:FAD-dependent oxidoreductase [Planctomycetaceae bacterium]